jgi:uncharacterized membrane protein required for colicin V production
MKHETKIKTMNNLFIVFMVISVILAILIGVFTFILKDGFTGFILTIFAIVFIFAADVSNKILDRLKSKNNKS